MSLESQIRHTLVLAGVLASLAVLPPVQVAALPVGAGGPARESALRMVADPSIPQPAMRPQPAAAPATIRVPGDVRDLQTAIYQVPDGGLIEVASGTYPSPANGFQIVNLGKGFTIRAASGANVVLEGNYERPLLIFYNTQPEFGRPVVFQNLIFKDGRSITDTIAGGVTVRQAQATFLNCTFQNNTGGQPVTGGGGAYVADNAVVLFVGTQWLNNSAKNEGGALAIQNHSRVFVHNSLFYGNLTNKEGHRATSAGGAVHVGNAVLRVSNTRFEANEAGYVGGALYAIGTWTEPVSVPQSDVLVTNSTFLNNRAYSATPYSSPTEGGAIHGEDQTLVRIYNSRFQGNQADIGGAVNSYRAELRVEDSVFQANRAVGLYSANGFGGAIAITSNDSPADANINRPVARLTVTSSFIQGALGDNVAQTAGGIYAAGDGNRAFGRNGVSQVGTKDQNRAQVMLDGVVMSDLNVAEQDSYAGTGLGAAMLVDLVALDVEHSTIVLSHALGSNNSSGGGMAIINSSSALITDTTLARNAADKLGGGLFVQGSELHLASSRLWANVANTSTDPCRSYGAGMFSSPAIDQGVTGWVSETEFIVNGGLPIFDDDADIAGYPTLVNDLRYNANRIYSVAFGSYVYANSLPGYCNQSVAQLNALTIQRQQTGTSTKKSQVPNVGLTQAPIEGTVLAAPSAVLPGGAFGDPPGPTAAYLAYAWTSGAAALDGSPVSGFAGTALTTAGPHNLKVGSNTYSVTVAALPAPTISFTSMLTPTSALSWHLDGSAPLDLVIDQGIAAPMTSDGFVPVCPRTATSYAIYAITAEGGAVAQATVDACELPFKAFLPLVLRFLP